MAQRRHHYEQAFEAYLRARRVPYVSVNEAKKALLPAGAKLELTIRDEGSASAPTRTTLKSFDFVVYHSPENLLVDVKGRKVAQKSGAPAANPGRLESWVTEEDVASLRRWVELFGAGFNAAFVFLYWCAAQPPDGLFQEVFVHRDRWYAVRAIDLEAYASHMKVRSAKWGTVHLSRNDFERLSQPLASGGQAALRVGTGPLPGPLG